MLHSFLKPNCWHQNGLNEFEKKIDWIVYTYKLKEESCSSSLSDSAKSLLAFSLSALLCNSSMGRGSPLSLPVSSAIPCPVLLSQKNLLNSLTSISQQEWVWKQWVRIFSNWVTIKPNVEVILLISLPFRILAFTEEVSLGAANNVRFDYSFLKSMWWFAISNVDILKDNTLLW